MASMWLSMAPRYSRSQFVLANFDVVYAGLGSDVLGVDDQCLTFPLSL
jgi:hypothetical protein